MASTEEVSPPVGAPPVPATPVLIAADNDSPAPTATPGEAIVELDIHKVVPNPRQPRRVFSPAALAELSDSIRQTGVIQPIVVRKTADGYELVAGERRLQAAGQAGLLTIPAIVRSMDSVQQAQQALIENIHRSDLNPIEKAIAYRQLIDQLGLTQEELAGRLSQDRSSIANHLRLLELHPTVQEAVSSTAISLGHAKLLAGVGDPARQVMLLGRVIQDHLSVRNLEKILQQPESATTPSTPSKKVTPHIADLEKRLSRALELRVEVRQGKKGGKGRLVLHYGSLDQFDNLLHRLGFESDE